MPYQFKLEVWNTDPAPRSVVASKSYATADKARSAMQKALKATDTLNELGLTDLAVAGRTEEVSE